MMQHRVTYSSVDARGNLLYPGYWIETYVLLGGTNVWFMVGRRPE